jgi:hypothetical protein
MLIVKLLLLIVLWRIYDMLRRNKMMPNTRAIGYNPVTNPTQTAIAVAPITSAPAKSQEINWNFLAQEGLFLERPPGYNANQQTFEKQPTNPAIVNPGFMNPTPNHQPSQPVYNPTPGPEGQMFQPMNKLK